MDKTFIKSTLGALIFRPYFLLRTAWPVWAYLLNREGRALWRGKEHEITPAGRRIAKDLRSNGIAFTHLDELFPGTKVFAQLRAHADLLLPSATVREGKPFLRQCWEDKGVLDISNPYVRFSLDERVLAAVNAYFGALGKFYYFSLDLTTVIPSDAPAIRSQSWHRDPEDKRMCKMFLYLNDVDEKTGPFIYIKGSQYGGRWGHVAPQRPPLGSYPEEGVVERSVPPEDIVTCTGKAGSVIFADTAGLHKGGYATGRERLMFTAEYSTKAALRPIHYQYPENFSSVREALGPAGRYAVDNDFGLLRILNCISDFSRKYNLH